MITRKEIIKEISSYVRQYRVHYKFDGPADDLKPLFYRVREDWIADRVLFLGDNISYDDFELYCDLCVYAHTDNDKRYDFFQLTDNVMWEESYRPSEAELRKIRERFCPEPDGGWRLMPAPMGTNLTKCRTQVTARLVSRKKGKATIEFYAAEVNGKCRLWAEIVDKMPELGVPVYRELKRPFTRTVEVDENADAAFRDEKGAPRYLHDALRKFPDFSVLLKEKEVTVVC